MVTHDANAASYCGRILFIQDGVLFHELRRDFRRRIPAGVLRAHFESVGAVGRRQCKCSLNLSLRNSKRSRRENGLFHASLLVVVIAFYVILALPKQDVIIFLKRWKVMLYRKSFKWFRYCLARRYAFCSFSYILQDDYQMERRNMNLVCTV